MLSSRITKTFISHKVILLFNLKNINNNKIFTYNIHESLNIGLFLKIILLMNLIERLILRIGMMIKMLMFFMTTIIISMDFLLIMMSSNQLLKELILTKILKSIFLLLPIIRKQIITNLIL